MSTHSSDTRELREDEDDGATDGSRAKGAASRVASANENGRLSLLLGGVLLARGARSLAGSRGKGRALLAGLAGAGLLAVGLRQRRSEAGAETDEGPKREDDEAVAHREQSEVLEGSETNPRGTAGEPDVEVENREGNVEFTEHQDAGPSHQPDLEEEAGVEDPRRDHGDEVEVDLSEASMADEASEATGPSSRQAQPAQTDTTEPERTADEDDETMDDTTDTAASEDGEDEPDPGAEPGEATEEATEADPENVADEIIEDEIDDEEREGVETEGGATVHTDTNEADNMDIDVEDVTDPDDDLHEGSEADDESGSHLDDEPPDESDDEE